MSRERAVEIYGARLPSEATAMVLYDYAREFERGWLRAVDEALICAHLGVANGSDPYETARQKLNALIDWHVAVACDPRVNGGLKLMPVDGAP